MSNLRKPMSIAMTTAIASASLAAGSLFSMDALAHGYLQDAGKAKPAATEGKCGEGKCGAGMMSGSTAKPASTAASTPAKPMHTFGDLDTDKDGRISRSEFSAAHGGKSDKFAGIDSNGDGFISKQEFDAHHDTMQKAMLDTVNMSLLGSVFGCAVALPVSFYLSSNFKLNKIYLVTHRLALSLLRTLPILVMAFFFRTVLGIGAMRAASSGVVPVR